MPPPSSPTLLSDPASPASSSSGASDDNTCSKSLALTRTTSSFRMDADERPASSSSRKHHHRDRRHHRHRHPSRSASSSSLSSSSDADDERDAEVDEERVTRTSLPTSSLSASNSKDSSTTAASPSVSMKQHSNTTTGHESEYRLSIPSSSCCQETPPTQPPPPLSSSSSSSESQSIQTPSVTSSAAPLISCSSTSGSQNSSNRAVSSAAASEKTCPSGSVLGSSIIIEGGSRPVTSTTSGQREDTTVASLEQLNKRSLNEPLAAAGQQPPSFPAVNLRQPPSSISSSSASSNTRHITNSSSSLKRFLTTLYHFTCDISPEVGEKVHALILSLVNSTTSIENFLSRIEEITRFPVRPYVVPFLRLHLPVLQAELANSAAALKLTPSKFLRQNESLILDPVSGRTTSSSSYHSSLHYLLPPGSHSLFTFPPAFVGEAFEIFQPTVANPIFTAPSSLQTIPTSYPYQPVSPPTPILTSNNMGIKENGVASKRRMSSPDSRKENGYIDVEKDVVEITHPAKRQVSSVSRVIPTQHSRGNNASIVSTTYPHVHHHLPSPSQTLLSATSLPLHPINSNGSALQTQLNIRSALMETSLREAVNSSYRFMNGNSSPKEVNGRPENAVENLQHQTSFSDRDRTNTSRSPNYSHLRTLQQRTSSDESVAPELFDDQFKSIYTMLNCILGMVDKTKQALSMIQQRSLENRATSSSSSSNSSSPPGIRSSASLYPSNRLSPAAQLQEHQKDHHNHQLTPSTLHHHPSHVIPKQHPPQNHSLSVTPSPTIKQLQKQQSLRASEQLKMMPVSLHHLKDKETTMESKGNDSLMAERVRMEKMMSVVRRQAVEDLSSLRRHEEASENCWNCGRKANETCSGCNVARYCGSFCQHKDWDNHHRVCGQSNGSVSTVNGDPSSSKSLSVLKSQGKSPSPVNGVIQRSLSVKIPVNASGKDE